MAYVLKSLFKNAPKEVFVPTMNTFEDITLCSEEEENVLSESAAPCVLVVDDDKDIRKIVNLTLKHLGGFHVVAVGSGEEALAWLQKRRFDLVILDMCMPDMDGEMTLRALHQLPNMYKVPVVLLTAHAPSRLSKDLEQWGIQHILEKPFDPIEFNRHIKEILSDGANNQASK